MRSIKKEVTHEFANSYAHASTAYNAIEQAVKEALESGWEIKELEVGKQLFKQFDMNTDVRIVFRRFETYNAP